jgi:uncharacterized protein
MRINLSEIPEEGKSFLYNNQTAELNQILFDLIGKSAHIAQFTIRPLNSKDFEMTGTIKTALPEQCSRCGIDFDFPISEKFHEILIPKQDQPRGGKYSKVNHLSDQHETEGPGSVEYDDGMHFNIGDYLHEVAALAAPFNPSGPEDENGDCSICKIPVRGRSFSYNEEMPSEKPQNPFSVLKNIKLN